MKNLTRQDLEDIANGAGILASGGGGSISMAPPLIKTIEEKGSVRLAELDEIPDSDFVVVSAGAGSPATAAQAGEIVEQLATASDGAFGTIEKHLGKVFPYAVAVETGVANTLLPMTVAAGRKISVIDGAGARRSVPSLTMTTFVKVPIPPMEIVSTQKQVVTVEVPTAAAAEQPMMAIISTEDFGDLGGIAFWPMSGSVAKVNTSKGTVSYALELGKTLRESKSSGDPVAAVCEYLGGFVLYKGEITKSTEQTSGSFDFVVIELGNGSDDVFRIYAQNESLIAWSSLSPHPVAMGPDLICYLTTDGEVFTNADLDLVQGKEVAVIGAPAPSNMRTPEIEQSFLSALSELGYGGPYVPIEELRKIVPPKARRHFTEAMTAPQPHRHWWRSRSSRKR